ncbi:MAG: hypothetical protein HY907_01705 [Deltaproteobacteria bacterium]|nr:hypothetical protein [Deltaproteobacteria bacterium]
MATPKGIAASGTGEIAVNGQWGTFTLNDADFDVHYFQTFGSPSRERGGDHFELLRQLEPMRSRVKASALKDLDSLLQRDLCDERIAEELVPYLLGKKARVGFFPPIVAVLMPKGFVGVPAAERPHYPTPSNLSGGVVNYDRNWSLRRFREDGHDLGRLGQLRINLHLTDIVVLDGQHRANAFRYVAGCFEPEDPYRPFYASARIMRPPSSDLPITVLWFASAKRGRVVSPNHISRELFVTVNNTVRKVSEARTVLLDEVDIVSLAVNTFYRDLARERGFDGRGLDLLAACFDLDRDLTDAWLPPMTLTTPIHLRRMIRVAFWGNTKCDKLIERAPRGGPTTSRFSKIFGRASYLPASVQSLRITDSDLRERFRVDFRRKFGPVLQSLFSSARFLDLHYQAREHLAEKLGDSRRSTPEKLTWWTNAYLGGEGLYGGYMSSDLPACAPVKRLLESLDEEFRDLRTKAFQRALRLKGEGTKDLRPRVDQVFESFATEAFQTGFGMTIDFVACNRYRDNWKKAVRDVTARTRRVPVEHWLTFFNEFREAYVGSVDPATWPRFRNMLLTVLHYDEFFGRAAEGTPARTMVRQRMRELCLGLLDGGGQLRTGRIARFANQVVEEVRAIYTNVGGKLPRPAVLQQVAVDEAEAIRREPTADE